MFSKNEDGTFTLTLDREQAEFIGDILSNVAAAGLTTSVERLVARMSYEMDSTSDEHMNRWVFDSRASVFPDEIKSVTIVAQKS